MASVTAGPIAAPERRLINTSESLADNEQIDHS